MSMSDTAGHLPKGGADRSQPRARVAAGDTSIDRRGRRRSAPAILSYGFRPFFLGAALWAALSVPIWVVLYFSGAEPAGPFSGLEWHVHEMLFGYLAAVIAGFALTAVPNWTGRLPLSGAPLAGLVALWLAGRFAVALLPWPNLVMAVDLAFPAVFALAIWREILAGRNIRNVPIAVLITLFGTANLIHHLVRVVPDLAGYGERLALAVAAVMIALVGGRIVPSFTRNWLARAKAARLPGSFGAVDRIALAATVGALAAWVVLPDHRATALLLVAAGAALLVRLARWQGIAAVREPIVFILHVGYLWLALALALLGLAILAPGAVPHGAALHALTAGAIATMTLAVMTRASLGHTGRPIASDPVTVAIYVLVTAGAALRVAAPFAGEGYAALLAAGAALWSGAFLTFAVGYWKVLTGPRADLR